MSPVICKARLRTNIVGHIVRLGAIRRGPGPREVGTIITRLRGHKNPKDIQMVEARNLTENRARANAYRSTGHSLARWRKISASGMVVRRPRPRYTGARALLTRALYVILTTSL